jgi:hypothetical protein
MDLEAVEMAFRAALHEAGAQALSQLLRFPEPGVDGATSPARAGIGHTVANCAHGAFSPPWAQWN